MVRHIKSSSDLSEELFSLKHFRKSFASTVLDMFVFETIKQNLKQQKFETT